MNAEPHSFEEIHTLLEEIDEAAFYAYDELYHGIYHNKEDRHDELAFYEALMSQIRTFRLRLARLEREQNASEAFRELESEFF